jgi:hypothetical protein
VPDLAQPDRRIRDRARLIIDDAAHDPRGAEGASGGLAARRLRAPGEQRRLRWRAELDLHGPCSGRRARGLHTVAGDELQADQEYEHEERETDE